MNSFFFLFSFLLTVRSKYYVYMDVMNTMTVMMCHKIKNTVNSSEDEDDDDEKEKETFISIIELNIMARLHRNGFFFIWIHNIASAETFFHSQLTSKQAKIVNLPSLIYNLHTLPKTTDTIFILNIDFYRISSQFVKMIWLNNLEKQIILFNQRISINYYQ